jgi:hypothetical protein
MSETKSQTFDVDEPEIIDAPEGVSVDRWTKYGHDRLYIEGARVEPYLDLDDGSLNETGRVRTDIEYTDDSVVIITIGQDSEHSVQQTVVIDLNRDDEPDTDDDDDDAGFSGMTEAEFDDLEVGDEVRHKNDDSAEEVISVGDYNPLAGGRTQVRTRRSNIGRNHIGNWTVVDQ